MNRRTFILILSALLAPIKRLLAKKPKPILFGGDPAYPPDKVYIFIHRRPDGIPTGECKKVNKAVVDEILNREYDRQRETNIKWYLDHIHGGEFPKDMGEIK